MSFVLDTGSAWMWVPSTDCAVNECSGDRYNSSKSDTFKTTKKVKDIQYGTGYLEGHISQD